MSKKAPVGVIPALILHCLIVISFRRLYSLDLQPTEESAWIVGKR